MQEPTGTDLTQDRPDLTRTCLIKVHLPPSFPPPLPPLPPLPPPFAGLNMIMEEIFALPTNVLSLDSTALDTLEEKLNQTFNASLPGSVMASIALIHVESADLTGTPHHYELYGVPRLNLADCPCVMTGCAPSQTTPLHTVCNHPKVSSTATFISSIATTSQAPRPHARRRWAEGRSSSW